MIVGGTVVGTLMARLHTEEGWKRNPHCLKPHGSANRWSSPACRAPAPRPCTSCSRSTRNSRAWKTGSPAHRSHAHRVKPGSSNPHYLQTVANLKAFFDAAPPAFRIAHEMVADEVDECLEVL
jgi:hypothetical protein